MRYKTYTYKTPTGKFTQKPLSSGAFENAIMILNEVGVSDIVALMNQVGQLLDNNKGGKVAIDVGEMMETLMTTLAKIGDQQALSNFLAIILNIDLQKAREIPMAVARSVVQDFFHLNADWLPTTPSILRRIVDQIAN